MDEGSRRIQSKKIEDDSFDLFDTYNLLKMVEEEDLDKDDLGDLNLTIEFNNILQNY